MTLPADVTEATVRAELDGDIDVESALAHMLDADPRHAMVTVKWAHELRARFGLTPSEALHVAVALYFG